MGNTDTDQRFHVILYTSTDGGIGTYGFLKRGSGIRATYKIYYLGPRREKWVLEEFGWYGMGMFCLFLSFYDFRCDDAVVCCILNICMTGQARPGQFRSVACAA